jgi:hypothetical protein
MSSTDTPTGLIALVVEELKGIAPTGFSRVDSAEYDTPRRYTWIPTDSPLGGPKKTGSAHTLDSIGLRFVVECWGHSFDDAFYMLAALLTAIQRAWGGRNYEANTVQPWEQRSLREGFVLSLQLEMKLHIMAIDLKAPPPTPPKKATAFERPPADWPLNAPPPPDDPAPVYGPTGTTLVTITAVAEATPALSTPGDGELEPTEP